MQTLAQIEKQKEEDYGHLINAEGGGSGGSDDADSNSASSFITGSESSPSVPSPPKATLAPIPADQVPGYYDVMLGGSTRPTRQPTNRPTNKPIINAEQEMHRYSFCGKFWTDARDNCQIKQHCEDDRDCPDAEFCWTQTPCDYYATDTPTTAPPSDMPSNKPTTPIPSKKPTKSPIGTTPTKAPTPEPSWPPTISPTLFPTENPTITPKPTDKPTYDKNDPSLTFFCGFSWADADETCGMRCPSGNSQDCPAELECWAFTSCKEEKGIITTPPTVTPDPPTPVPITIYVPGPGGAQVPVFGGVDYSQFEPTVSPAPTASGEPTVSPTLPPGVVAREKLATYYCGKDWNDVETNCHQACPSGNNMECEDPEHSCWAFVYACKAKSAPPTDSPLTESPTRPPVTMKPTRDPDLPQPTNHPTDLYDLLEGKKGKFYCASSWDGIDCSVSKSCPTGDDIDCPTGESCFSSLIDCSAPQPLPSNPPTRSPERRAEPQPEQPGQPSANTDINNEGEDWGSSNEQVNNEGEDWGPNEEEQINNEGEDWGSTGVNNEGEIWSQPKPTGKPTPGRPTPDPTPEPTIDLIDHLENLKNSYFCSESWDNIDCDNAQSCPSGDSKDCPKKQQCFSGTPCKPRGPPSTSIVKDEGTPGSKPTGGRPSGPGGSPAPTIWTPLMGDKDGGSSDNSGSETELNEVTAKFFCGASWSVLVENCDAAKPCPSGTNAECEGGQSCFANTPCGKYVSPPKEEVYAEVGILNFAAMVDKIPPFCEDEKTMSRNVGYWQSWSIL